MPLRDLRKELILVQQQTEIEASVHAATAEFLRHMATKLQEQSINWSRCARSGSKLQGASGWEKTREA